MGLISSLESCNTQEALSDFLKENTSTWNDDFRRSEFIKTLASKRNLVRNDDDPLVAEKIIELLYRCVEIKDGQELCDIPSVGDLVVQCFKCAKSDTSLSQVGEIVEKMIQYSDGLVEAAAAAAASAGGNNHNNNNNNSDHKKKSASLYCTVEIAQLLVKSLDQCTSSTSVININNAISSCVVDATVAKALAVDPLTSSSLLKILNLYSNDSNINIEILAGVISAVVRIVTTDGNRDDVFSLYSSPAWISSITTFLNYCATTIENDDDASSHQSTIASNLFTLINIINSKSPQAHSLLASETVASSMVAALSAHHQSNEKTAKLGVTAIDGIVQKEPSKDYLNGVFANSETIALLVNILNVHTASAAVVLPAVRIMHRIVCAFPNDHQSTLFSSRLTATTLIETLAKYASNAPVPSIICSVIALSSRDPTTAQNFRLAPNCLSTFTSLLRHHGSTVNDQLGPILYALCYITRCDPARSLFAASKEFLEVFEAASKNATKPMAKSTVLIIVKALAGEYNNTNASTTTSEEQQQIAASTTEPSTTRQEVAATKSNENDGDDCSSSPTAASTKQECSTTTTTTPPSPEAAWSAYPPERCFVRGVPKDLSFRESLAALLSIRELPHEILPDGSKRILRPDLEDYIPTDDDVETLTRKADRELVLVKARPAVQELIKNNDLTDDDIRALLLYKVEQPYPLYLWLNAWLMGQRRDEKIKQTVGPFFTRIHRAMEKLPKIKSRASRSVRINKNIIPQYEARCAAVGRPMSFWGFSSFSKNDAVVEHKNGEETIDIIYSCPELEGVDMEPFKPEGSLLAMDESKNNNDEILPLCPAVFEVVSCSTKNDDVSEGKKLLTIEMKQLDHKEFCYVLPK